MMKLWERSEGVARTEFPKRNQPKTKGAIMSENPKNQEPENFKRWTAKRG
jgi:hypothetical protein